MNTEQASIATLTLDPDNVRTHGDRNIEAIAASLKQFGQQRPIVTNRDGTVLAGNGTVLAAISLGWSTVDVVRSDLGGEEAKAYAIADNKTAELGDWNFGKLSEQVNAMPDELVGSLGFEDYELDAMQHSEWNDELGLEGEMDDELPPPEVAGEDATLKRFIVRYKTEDDKQAIADMLGVDGKKIIYTPKETAGA